MLGPLNTHSIARCERGETWGRRKPCEDNNPTSETGPRFRDRGVHRGLSTSLCYLRMFSDRLSDVTGPDGHGGDNGQNS